MQSIQQISKLNASELSSCTAPSASWHTDYRDSAYIYIGGLAFTLSEGDVLAVFSQYGDPVHIHLVRDKETGKSKGFAFLKYADQRSCDVAVDNLSGAVVLGRTVSVDHARYERKEGEVEGFGSEEEEEEQEKGDGESESEEEERRPLLREEVELRKLLGEPDDGDPMKAYLVKAKREEVAEALKRIVKVGGGVERKHRHHRSRREEDGGEEEGRSRRHRARRNRDREDEDEVVEKHSTQKSRRDRESEMEGQYRISHSSRKRNQVENGRPSHKSRRDRSSRSSSLEDDDRQRRQRSWSSNENGNDKDKKRQGRRDDRIRSRSPHRRR